MKDASGCAEELLARIWVRDGEDPQRDGDIAFSGLLGRRVRAGELSDQRISTLDKIRDAIVAGELDRAAELADFFADEAAVIHGVYRGRDSTADLRSWQRRRGPRAARPDVGSVWVRPILIV